MLLRADVVADLQPTDHAGQVTADLAVADQLGHHVAQRLYLVAAEEQQALRLGVHQQAFTDRMPLGVVAVQQFRWRPAVHGGGQLPTEIDGVLDARVHALAAGRQMDVRGIAGQQDPAAAVLGRLAGRVAEGGAPGRRAMADVLAGQPLPALGDLGEAGRLGPLAGRPVLLAHHDPDHAVAQRAGHDHAARPGLAGHPRLDVRSADVGDEHLHGRGATGKIEPGRLADGAASAVAADQVARPHPAFPVRGSHGDVDTVAVTGEVDQFVPSADVRAQIRTPFGEHLLGLALRNTLAAEMRSLQHAEVDRQATEMAFVADLDVAEPGQQSALVEDFHGARGETESARLSGRCGKTFQHNDIDVRQA